MNNNFEYKVERVKTDKNSIYIEDKNGNHIILSVSHKRSRSIKNRVLSPFLLHNWINLPLTTMTMFITDRAQISGSNRGTISLYSLCYPGKLKKQKYIVE